MNSAQTIAQTTSNHTIHQHSLHNATINHRNRILNSNSIVKPRIALKLLKGSLMPIHNIFALSMDYFLGLVYNAMQILARVELRVVLFEVMAFVVIHVENVTDFVILLTK